MDWCIESSFSKQRRGYFIIGANMIGAHMSDKPNDHKPIYIGAITHEENNMSSDKKIEVEFYANYDEVKEVK